MPLLAVRGVPSECVSTHGGGKMKEKNFFKFKISMPSSSLSCLEAVARRVGVDFPTSEVPLTPVMIVITMSFPFMSSDTRAPQMTFAS